MRIALVVTGGFDRSGRERVVPSLLWLVERLAARHAVHVFALHHYREPCEYVLRGATVHDVGRVGGPPGLRRHRLRTRLAAAIASHGPFDVLHAYCGMPAGVAGAPVAARFGVPFILTLDSGELVSLDDIGYGLQRRWFDRRAIAAAIRSAARVTVATEQMARLLRDGAGAGSAAPSVVPFGIDTNCFQPAPPPDGPPWRLLRVASVNRVKDFPTLLYAFASVVHHVPATHLDIAGEDTLDGSMQALVRSLGLERHVTFHGFQPTDALAALYARAHVHVVSSRHEAASVAVLEAAAAGVPTVGTAVGYVADWNPERAVAVPVRDADALARAIIELLGDPQRRRQIASAAQAWARQHDADWTAARLERLYAEAAARSPLH